MNNKFVFFVLILICGLVCVGSVSAHDQCSLNATDTISANTGSELNLNVTNGLNSQVSNGVSNNTIYNNSVSNTVVSDSNITAGNQSNSLTDLKNLLGKGSGNYTLNNDYKFNSSLDKDFNGIAISSGDYVINGNNHTIDGASSTSLFNIAGGHVTLSNITFTNFTGCGAVMDAKNCDLNMSNCILINPELCKNIFDDFFKKGSYSAVCLDHVNANIYENSFINNKWGGNGAALNVYNCNLTLIHNVFKHNQANYLGGAVYIACSRTTSSLNNFTNNVGGKGGAIYFDDMYYDSNYNSSVMKDRFMNNTASYGGAIFSAISRSDVFVTYSDFMNNTAKNGNAICAGRGDVSCKGDTFNGKTSFIPSWGDVYGNGIFMTNSTQNNTFDDSVVSSNVVSVSRTSANTFCINLVNGSSTNVYQIAVYDVESFKNASKFLLNNKVHYDVVLIDFKANSDIHFKPWDGSLLSQNPDFVGRLIIRGNGATIKVDDPDFRGSFHFLDVKSKGYIIMNNITIEGFNTAVSNFGLCHFTNVTFRKNCMHYYIDESNGGAIRNHNFLNCVNCTFDGNEARFGDAIYNDKFSSSTLTDCIFVNSTSWGINTIFRQIASISDEESVYTNNYIKTCDGASCIIINTSSELNVFNISNTDDFKKSLDAISHLGHVNYAVLNFTQNMHYESKDSSCTLIKLNNVDNLIINGNGATFSIINHKDDNFCHFVSVLNGQSCVINNFTITGFNQPLLNHGSLYINNTIFKSNKCDYCSEKDYGGTIYNFGVVSVFNSKFEDGYAKYGSSIYNCKGIVNCNYCNFTGNKDYSEGGVIYNCEGRLVCNFCNFMHNSAHYGGAIYDKEGVTMCNYCNFTSNSVSKDGGAIYGDHAYMICNYCNFTGNSADDDGGAIFNHYGVLILSNSTFAHDNAGDDGKEIYNDFGHLVLNMCVFYINPNENNYIFNYGKDCKCENYNSTVIQNGEVVLCSISSDAPSEGFIWFLRISEIAISFALVVTCEVCSCGTLTVLLVTGVGGMLLAAGEEFIEGCINHNVNFGSCLCMAVISGVFSAVCGGGAHLAANYLIKNAAKKVLKAVVAGAIDLVGEIATEVVPRPFDDFDIGNDMDTSWLNSKN